MRSRPIHQNDRIGIYCTITSNTEYNAFSILLTLFINNYKKLTELVSTYWFWLKLFLNDILKSLIIIVLTPFRNRRNSLRIPDINLININLSDIMRPISQRNCIFRILTIIMTELGIKLDYMLTLTLSNYFNTELFKFPTIFSSYLFI